MKTQSILICSMVVLSGLSAQAIPLLGESTALNPAGSLPLYPDSDNKNLYYFGPNTLEISVGTDNVPKFIYIETQRASTFSAIVQTVLHPSVHQSDLDAAEKNELTLNPSAVFTSLPFTSSKIEISDELKPFVESNDCDHTAGNLLDDISCILTLNPEDRDALLSSMRSSPGIAVNFVYEVTGADKKPDGTLTNKDVTFVTAGHIGGAQLKAFPNLFLGIAGYPLEFPDGE